MQSTQVPGLSGSVTTVGLSPLTSGDLEGWRDQNGIVRSAPSGACSSAQWAGPSVSAPMAATKCSPSLPAT